MQLCCTENCVTSLHRRYWCASAPYVITIYNAKWNYWVKVIKGFLCHLASLSALICAIFGGMKLRALLPGWRGMRIWQSWAKSWEWSWSWSDRKEISNRSVRIFFAGMRWRKIMWSSKASWKIPTHSPRANSYLCGRIGSKDGCMGCQTIQWWTSCGAGLAEQYFQRWLWILRIGDRALANRGIACSAQI